MSAYAANVSTKKSSQKNRKTKSSILLNRGKLGSEALGFSLKAKLGSIVSFGLEWFLCYICGVFVLSYVVIRKFILKTKSKPRRNPYSASNVGPSSKSYLYKDFSDPLEYQTSQSPSPVKVCPPKCLEDPVFGVHKFIKLQGVKLHYVESTKSKKKHTLLLVHGAFDFWFTWRKMIPILARKFRVICIDLRGCGDSDKPVLRSSYTLDILTEDIASLMHSLGSKDEGSQPMMSLIGCGWGGHICWSVAQKYPGLIHKMVLIQSPHPHLIQQYNRSSVTSYYRLWPTLFARIPLLPEWAASEDKLALVSRLIQPAINSMTKQEIDTYYYNFSRREDVTGAINHVRNWTPWAVSEPPSVLTTPTLLLMGDKDPDLPVDITYKSAEFVERIKTRVIQGASSWPVVTHSQEVLQEIGNFFNEPTILEMSQVSSDDEWDDNYDDNSHVISRQSSVVGRMVGAGLSAVSNWTPKPHQLLFADRNRSYIE